MKKGVQPSKSRKFSLGIDFGTESGRCVLVDIHSGELAASSVHAYGNGVITDALPVKGRVPLESDWALQDPEDYLETLRITIPTVLKKAKAKPEQITGIGIDFTSSTILPVKSDGTPLCSLPSFRKNPHSWVKLWKHHSAQPEADRINRIASERKDSFLKRYGGKVSCEWLFPKTLEILNDSPEIYQSADRIMEAQDWVVWRLTGSERRSACGAGYKALWSKQEGFPSKSFFKDLHPLLETVTRDKIGERFYPPGFKAGGLSPDWAEILGLAAETPVSVPIIDAHSAVLGCGIFAENEMLLCMGTSVCHLLLSSEENEVSGICGVVEDGILPGSFGYEAGQAAVGDIFNWFIKFISDTGNGPGGNKKMDHYTSLERKAALLKPGESGLLALDWWNGNRSVLVDSGLSGLVLGLNLGTDPHHVYRALMDACAMGTMRIIQEFESSRVPVKKLVATGGLAEKSPLLMQIFADVTGRKITVSHASHVCARGAAALGVLCSEPDLSRNRVKEVVRILAPKESKCYSPNRISHGIYHRLYEEYCRLHDYFGRGQNPVMRILRELKH